MPVWAAPAFFFAMGFTACALIVAALRLSGVARDVRRPPSRASLGAAGTPRLAASPGRAGVAPPAGACQRSPSNLRLIRSCDACGRDTGDVRAPMCPRCTDASIRAVTR